MSEPTELEAARQEIVEEVGNLRKQEALSIQLLLTYLTIHSQTGRIDWENRSELSLVITNLSADVALSKFKTVPPTQDLGPVVFNEKNVPENLNKLAELLRNLGIRGTLVTTILYDSNNKANPVYGWAIPSPELPKFKAIISQVINAN